MSTPDPPRYEPYSPAAPATHGGLVCPKCRGAMRTYERNGVHLEQCDTCRGVFLDFGELEQLTQLETRMAPPPVAGYQPDWGMRDGYRYRRGGIASLFFS